MNRTLTASIALTAGLALHGCATTGSNGGTVDDALTEDEASFFTQSSALACAGGSLIGALAGLLADCDNKLVCATGGAVAGCALGAVGNYALDSVRASYHNKEDQLNATINSVQSDNDRVTNTIKASKTVLQKDREKLAKMEKQLSRGEISGDDMRQQKLNMDANLEHMQKELAEVQKRYNTYLEARNSLAFKDNDGKASHLTAQEAQTLRKLDEEIEVMQQKIKELDSTVTAYSAARTVTSVSDS